MLIFYVLVQERSKSSDRSSDQQQAFAQLQGELDAARLTAGELRGEVFGVRGQGVRLVFFVSGRELVFF